MLAKCANPECSEVFRYLASGKLFRMPSRSPDGTAATGLEHFWLCPVCARTMTVAVERSGRVVVIARAVLRPYREMVGRISTAPQISQAQLPGQLGL
jgi:hypothetical protein